MNDSYKIYASKDYVDSKALPEGATAHQQLVTGTDGNTKWSDYAYTRVKQVFVYNGDYAKTPSTAPGYSTNALYTSMFTLAKISDYVPTIDELFSDETTAIFDSGVVGEDIPDLKHVYDGYYGRFKFTKAPSTVTNPSSEDGLFPGIIVVSKPSIVFEVFDCYEPGIYIWTSKTGKQYATKSVTINCALPMDSSVPYISSSQPGQTITVKSIDENGKPTEWEAENVVKTINSVEPDENGDIAFIQPCTQGFMTMPNGVIVNMFSMPVQDVINQLAGRFAYALRIYRIEMMGNDVRYATRVSVGENPTSAVLYFGDDVAPIILDGENNKIITDPDWVAPTAAVKTINGVEPDEDGDVKPHYAMINSSTNTNFPLMNESGELSSHFAFAARFVVMGNSIMCDSTAKEIANAIGAYEKCVIRFTHVDIINRVATPYSHTTDEQIYDENGNIAGWSHTIHFGNKICPIVINPIANTITIDPNWVAPAESIPAPAVASVGQIIAVKSVDGNGKPTEWETIDPWTITSPNGTQFKLTIDDEGILSATELT